MGRRVVMVTMAAVVAATTMTGCRAPQPQPAEPDCVFTVDDNRVELDAEQTANAATVAAVGLRQGIPEQGVVVALATAWQESGLRNIDYGDRDSLGLFQQRPSQGWGDEEQIMDPRYAAEQFYLHLERVDNWQDMRVTDAAQAVQRSAFPEEYQQWAPAAEVMARVFGGTVGAALRCTGTDAADLTGSPDELSTALLNDWGEWTELHIADGALLVPTNDDADGWRYAHWLVAHARTQAVAAVTFAEHTWTPDTGQWRPDDTPDDPDVVTVRLTA